MRALVADDRDDVRLALELLLKRAGHQGEGACSPREVQQALERSSYDLLLLDLNYTRDTTSGREGLDLLLELQRSHPELPVVAMTAWGSVELAVEAMREGARDFVLKPWDDEKLLRTLERHGRPRRDGLDLDRAGRVQARFRPRAAPVGGSLECAGACVEAGAVGGDVLDVAPGHVGLLVCCSRSPTASSRPGAATRSSGRTAWSRPSRARAEPLAQIPAALLSGVSAFASDEEKDDRAVLVARVREAQA